MLFKRFWRLGPICSLKNLTQTKTPIHHIRRSCRARTVSLGSSIPASCIVDTKHIAKVAGWTLWHGCKREKLVMSVKRLRNPHLSIWYEELVRSWALDISMFSSPFLSSDKVSLAVHSSRKKLSILGAKRNCPKTPSLRCSYIHDIPWVSQNAWCGS